MIGYKERHLVPMWIRSSYDPELNTPIKHNTSMIILDTPVENIKF